MTAAGTASIFSVAAIGEGTLAAPVKEMCPVSKVAGCASGTGRTTC